jgi:hypothetical protein
MANIKVSALTSVASLNAADTFPVVQSGVTKKAAISDISNLMLTQAPQTSFRNIIHNGNFIVDQRANGTSHNVAVSTTAYTYYIDRWFASTTGVSLLGLIVTGAVQSTSRNNFRLNGNVGNTGFNIGQRVESINVSHLAGIAGQIATLQLKVASSSLTSLTYTISHANSTDAFGTLGTPTKTTIVTGTIPVTSVLERRTVTFTMPSNAKNGVEILFTGGALSGSQTFTLADVQLESGSVATAFESRPYSVELALCQRYLAGFTTSNYGSTATGAYTVGNGNSQSTTNNIINIPFSTRMRTRPTGITNTSLTNFSLVNGSGISGVPVSVFHSNSGIDCGQIVISCTAGTPTLVAGQGAYLNANASAANNQFILFTGAEL